MKKKNVNILKVGKESAPKNFSDGVMNRIEKEEAALSRTLLKQGGMITSPDFTNNLMAQLEAKSIKKAYTPVISMKAWIGIAVAFIGIVFLIFNSEENPEGKYAIVNNIQAIKLPLDSLFSNLSSISYIVLGAIVLSFLLLIEQRLNKTSS